MNRKSVLVKALKAAGEVILHYDLNRLESQAKSSVGDLVTSADLESEKIIRNIIANDLPDDLLISEETAEGQDLLTVNKLHELSGWVIDPIDGTNNFIRGMRYSGVSIGYIENGSIVLGGIINPYTDEIYLAETGKGATCNGQLILVSSKTIFDKNTRVCTSNFQENGGTLENLARYQKLGDVWVDSLGSAVLIMVDVASGKLDLYHHNGLKPWDNAAGFLILSEAGAKIVGLKGEPISWLSNEVVAGNPLLVDEFIRLTS